MPNKYLSALFLLTFLCVVSVPVIAQDSPWAVSDHARARILPGLQTIGDQDILEAVLEFELADGWHSYWKHPGDTGLPIRLEWDASRNVENVELFWPLPVRKVEQGLFTVFSYSEKIRMPLDVHLENPATDTNLNLTVKFMVCKDICIPAELDLALNIKAGSGIQTSWAKLIEKEKRALPRYENSSALSIENIVAGEDALVISAAAKDFDDLEAFVFIQDDLALTAEPSIEVFENGIAILKIDAPEDIENLSAYLTGKTLSVTLIAGNDSLEREISF